MKKIIAVILIGLIYSSCRKDGISFGSIDPPAIFLFRFHSDDTKKDLVKEGFINAGDVFINPAIKRVFFERYDNLILLDVRNYSDFTTRIKTDTIEFDFSIDYGGSLDYANPRFMNIVFNNWRDTISFDFQANPELYQEIYRRNYFLYTGEIEETPFIIDVPIKVGR